MSSRETTWMNMRSCCRNASQRLRALPALVFVCAFVLPAEATCPLELRGASGSLVARIGAAGDVRGSSGSLVARIKGGEVRGANGSLIGRYDANGDIRGASGSLVGRVGSDGEVRGSSGSLVFRISPKGEVRRSHGSLAYRASGYSTSCSGVVAAWLLLVAESPR